MLDIRTTVFDNPFTRKGKMLETTTLFNLQLNLYDAPAAPHTIKKSNTDKKTPYFAAR